MKAAHRCLATKAMDGPITTRAEIKAAAPAEVEALADGEAQS